MNKLYSVHDHWTDINKKNDVDIESIDGVITGIKVNGEDYGGGESSDFSIATLTLTNTTKNRVICEVPCYRDGVKVVSTRAVALGAIGGEPSTATFNVICETNGATLTITTADITATTTGNIQYIEEQQVYIITGDCSITLAGSLH